MWLRWARKRSLGNSSWHTSSWQLSASRRQWQKGPRSKQRRPLSACGKTRNNWPTPIAKAADRRLARHMSAQRVALQKEMRQLQVDQAATMETAAKARRSHIERIRELEAELTQAKANGRTKRYPWSPKQPRREGWVAP